jgi:hypothetical protein
MILSSKNIQVFQDLYFKRFGIRINEKQAREKGLNLVVLLDLVYKPIKRSDHKQSLNNET